MVGVSQQPGPISRLGGRAAGWFSKRPPFSWGGRFSGRRRVLRYALPLCIPFVLVEWLCRALVRFVQNTVPGIVRVGAVAIAVWTFYNVYLSTKAYLYDAENRTKQKQYQAWQVINTAQGKAGQGGRIQALQDLNEDGVPLDRIDLTDAKLDSIQLPGARLAGAVLDNVSFVNANLRRAYLRETHARRVNFDHAILDGVNLQSAWLVGASFAHAHVKKGHMWLANLDSSVLMRTRFDRSALARASFRGAILDLVDFPGAGLSSAKFDSTECMGTNFAGADLRFASLVACNLSVANFDSADLRYATLDSADLSGAFLAYANLDAANVRKVDLSGARLQHARLNGIRNWQSIRSIDGANLYGAVASAEFLQWAAKNGAVFLDVREVWVKQEEDNTWSVGVQRMSSP